MKREALLILCCFFYSTSEAQVYEPQPIPCLFFNADQTLNSNYSYECVESNNSELRAIGEVEITANKQITLLPGTNVIASSDGQIEFRSGGSEFIEAAWFEPSTVGVVGQFEKLELGLNLPEEIKEQILDFKNSEGLTGLNPFDPESIDVHGYVQRLDPNTMEWGTIKKVFGFYYDEFERDWADANYSLWTWNEISSEYSFRVRYAPKFLGEHRIILHATIDDLIISSATIPFSVVHSDNLGFVYSKTTSHYLNLGNQMFFPVGQNMSGDVMSGNAYPESCDFLNECWAGGASPEVISGIYSAPQYIDPENLPYGISPYNSNKMAPAYYNNVRQGLEMLGESGANTFRIINFGWNFELEYAKLNNYMDNLNMAWEFDRMLDVAKENNLKMHWCMQGQYGHQFNPYKFSFWDWEDNPENPQDIGYCYHTELGLEHPREFLTNDLAISNYKKKIRYYIARWGYSTDISVIELFAEINAIGAVEDENESSSGYMDSPIFQKEIYDWQ